MGELRAASRRRSRKSLCESWSCSCSSAGPCRCGCGVSSWPRPPAPPQLQGLHGSASSSHCSYRRLINNFEDVLRRRLRGRMRSSRLSPSIRTGLIITTQKIPTSASESLLLSVLFPIA